MRKINNDDVQVAYNYLIGELSLYEATEKLGLRKGSSEGYITLVRALKRGHDSRMLDITINE